MRPINWSPAKFLISAFLLIVILNGFVFWITYWNNKNALKTLQSLSSSAQVPHHLLSDLDKIELAFGQINAPGNNIFFSKNLKKEKKLLSEAQYQLTQLQNDFRLDFSEVQLINDSFSLTLLNDLEKQSFEMNSLSEKVFHNYSKKDFIKATYYMAKLDQSYGQARLMLSELRRILEKQLRGLNEQSLSSISEQSQQSNKMLSIAFVATITLMLFGNFLIKKLLKSEEISNFYRFALDNAAIVVATDSKGNITYANDAFVDISGYTLNELLNKNNRILNSSFHSPDFFNNLWQTISSGMVWQDTVRNKRKNGDYYWVNSTIVPMLDKNNKVQQYVAIQFDITQKKLNESTIANQQEELDQFFKNSQDLLCIAETTGYFKKLSPSFMQVLGYTEQELLNKPFVTLVHPDDRNSTYVELEKLSKGFPTLSFTNRYLCKNGQYISFSWKATAGASGKIYAIARDITKNLEFEQSLREISRAAEAAADAKTRFLATMSHEIRTPLNGIIGMVNLLLGTNLQDHQIDKLNIIQNCGNNLLDIINDILDFSKLEAGKVEIEFLPFQLDDCVNECLELLKHKALEKSLTINYKPSPDIPSVISGDAGRVRQILMNLIGNAIKFTQKGSVTIESSFRKVKAGDFEIFISVQDTGPGISKEAQSKLFKSFSQAEASTTRQYGGTGLGLAISKGLCEIMGGRIWVESQVGKGTKFSFSFRARSAKGTTLNISAPEHGATSKMIAQSYPLEILIAEDNRVNQLVLCGILEKLGYRSDVAANGLEVLAAVKQKKYDLILMDCHMPQMDGFEATEKLKTNFPVNEIPRIVAVTASTAEEDINRCRIVGMDGFLSKPVEMSELIRVLKSKSKSIPTAKTENNTINMKLSPIICDFEKLGENFKGMESLLMETIDQFCIHSQLTLNKIKTAIEQQDLKLLTISAHSMKGMLLNFYAKPASDWAKSLEEMGKSGNLNLAIDNFENLKQEHQLLTDALREFQKMKTAA